MLIEIPGVLTPAQVAHFRARLGGAEWVDGNVTSGHQAARAKYNQQVPENSPVARELGEAILVALSRSPLFMSAALPKQVFPPLFNRYGEGMSFGNHIDSAIRSHGPTGVRIRTDLSATLFLTPPSEYDGGDLLVDDTFGEKRVKLDAGSLVLYPATSLHRVEPITRGQRIGSFFWIQSLVREDAQRALLFDLDMSIIRLTQAHPSDPSLVGLTGVYNNLLRMWSQP